MKGNPLRKAAFDMSRMQISWAFWFIAISLLIYLLTPLTGINVMAKNQLGEFVERIVNRNWEGEVELPGPFGYMTFISHPSKIFMLVCGITSVYSFMAFYVKQGITRKTYFYGSMISSVVLASGIALAAGLIFVVETVFLGSEQGFATPWVAAMLVHGLFLFSYFVFGWVIGASFYRSAENGLLSILLTLAMAFASESLLNGALMDRWNLPESLELIVSWTGMALLLGLALGIVRMTTRNAPIRMK